MSKKLPERQLSIANDEGKLIFKCHHPETGSCISPLFKEKNLNKIHKWRSENVSRLATILGDPLKTLSAEDALKLIQKVNQIIEHEVYREKDINDQPGGVLSIPNKMNSIIVGDFKTTRVKLLPKKIAYNHRLQLYCYAYMLIQRGYVVNTIEITYIKRNIDGEVSAKTGKTGKVYPPELLTLTEPFTAENYTFIKSLLMLCAETFEEFLKQPNLAYLFYKDYRYKNKTFDISKFKEQESEF